MSVFNTQLLIGAREHAEQLQRALVSRTVIDQAIGILRSRTGGSAEEAFHRLRQISQSENVKLAVIAQRILEERSGAQAPATAVRDRMVRMGWPRSARSP